MPGVSDDELVKLEERLKELPDITQLLDQQSLEDILSTEFASFEMEVLDSTEVSYRCDCSREKVEDAVSSLHPDELKNMIQEDGGAEVVCHFCSKKYTFTKEDLEQMAARD